MFFKNNLCLFGTFAVSPLSFQAQVLSKLDGRDKEAKDAARAAMMAPKWTIAKSRKELEEVIKLSGFSDVAIVAELYAIRANDPREKDIQEQGLSPVQVTLDQAAHLMDAVALGHIQGGWDEIKPDLAKKYTEGGYPEIATLIVS